MFNLVCEVIFATSSQLVGPRWYAGLAERMAIAKITNAETDLCSMGAAFLPKDQIISLGGLEATQLA